MDKNFYDDSLSSAPDQEHFTLSGLDNDNRRMEILREGDRGAAIAQLQIKLQGLSLYPGRIDGSFGPLTKVALLDFQGKYGLKERGVFGVETWHALTFWSKPDRFDLLDSLSARLRELFLPDDLMRLTGEFIPDGKG
jgi:murein L,D-transpeptidase YcbB/YkuD